MDFWYREIWIWSEKCTFKQISVAPARTSVAVISAIKTTPGILNMILHMCQAASANETSHLFPWFWKRSVNIKHQSFQIELQTCNGWMCWKMPPGCAGRCLLFHSSTSLLFALDWAWTGPRLPRGVQQRNNWLPSVRGGSRCFQPCHSPLPLPFALAFVIHLWPFTCAIHRCTVLVQELC